MAEPDALTSQHGYPQHEAAAQSFVTARYSHRATRLRLIGSGEWSQAYAFTLDGTDSVIRFGRFGEDFLKDQVMGAYSSADLPIPAVRETGHAADGYFAVSDRAPGCLLNDLDGAAMQTALPGLLRAQDALRAVEIAGASGYGIWHPTAPLPPRPGRRPCWPSARKPPVFAGGGPPWPPHLPARKRSARATPGCKNWSPGCRTVGTSSTGTW
jgi:hypothetical protein